MAVIGGGANKLLLPISVGPGDKGTVSGRKKKKKKKGEENEMKSVGKKEGGNQICV